MLNVYIDGASAGNPGLSGAGIFMVDNGQVERYSIPLGMMDNHEAEYWALIKAIEICLEKNIQTVSFRSDSQAICLAMEKQFTKNRKYAPLLEQAIQLSESIPLFFIKWIPSSQNKSADQLAREAVRIQKGE